MRVILSVLFLFLSLFAWGQESTSLEESAKKKEINEIKLTGDAIYADLYQDAIEDEFDIEKAKIRSKEMLMTHVIEIFSKRLNMSKEDVREIWEVLDQRCANIVVKKGDLFRVFTYVMKNSFGLGKTNKKQKEPVLMAEVQSDSKSKEKAVVASQPLVPTTPKVESKAVVSATPKVESKPEVKSEPKVEPKPEPKPEPKTEAAPVPEPVVKAEPVLEVVVPTLCQTMISKGNMSDLMRYLNQEKKYQRLMYGNRNSMQFLDKCYIVIIDKGTQKIVSVLDKGDSERMNFVTKKLDGLVNYRGGNYAAIYVQEY